MYIVRNQTWWATRFPENKVLGNSGEREQLPFIYTIGWYLAEYSYVSFTFWKKNNEWILRIIAIRRFEDKKKCIFFITWPVRTRTDADGPWFVSHWWPHIFFFFTIVKYFFLYIWIHCGCKGSFMYLFYKLS